MDTYGGRILNPRRTVRLDWQLFWFLLSALTRGFLTQASVIYGSAAFVSTVGANYYSRVVLYCSLISALLYSIFLFATKSAIFQIYWVFIFALGLASIGAYLHPHGVPYLYGFAACALVLEIIGENITLAVAQASFNPAVFKTVLLKLFSSDICGRIIASLLLVFGGRSKSNLIFFSCVWAMLGTHLACILVTGRSLSGPGSTAANSPPETRRSSLVESFKQIKVALGFLFSNPLVRIGLLGFMWNRATKFSVEAVFYSSMTERYHSASTVASFVSWSMVVIIGLTLLVQLTLVRKAQERLPVASLFSVVPIGIVLISSVAFIANPFWPTVILYLFYQCGQRAIFLPILRQLLLPTPKSLGHSIFFLVIILSILSNVIFTATMSALKETWGAPHYLGLLVILGLSILYFATELDSSYIGNLWSHFLEFKSGEWMNAQWSAQWNEGFASEPTELTNPDRSETVELSETEQKARAVLTAYSHSYDEDTLAKAVSDHKALVHHPKTTEEAELGLSLLQEAGFPEHDAEIQLLSIRGAFQTQGRATRILRAAELSRQLEIQHLSVGNRKSLQDILIYSIQDGSLTTVVSKLKSILRLTDSELSNRWVQILNWTWHSQLSDLISACIDEQSHEVTLLPLVQGMYGQTFREAKSIRDVLIYLKRDSSTPILLEPFIKEQLHEIQSHSFNIWSQRDKKPRRWQALKHELLHTLFLEEWSLGSSDESGHLLNTISEIYELSDRERLILVDMHLEYLKRSPQVSSWRSILLPA